MGIFSFLTERDWSRNIAMATALRVSSRFFFDANLWPSFKNTASIFPEIRLFNFPLFCCKPYTSSLHNRKMSISLKRKKIFQKEKRHSSVF